MSGYEGRQSGRTAEQMRGAPFGATYVWPVARSLSYAAALARHLHREDLALVGADAVEPQSLRGLPSRIILDHALWEHVTSRRLEEWEAVQDNLSRRHEAGPAWQNNLMAPRPLPELPAEAGAAYDPVREVLRLYGISYTLALFKAFGEGGLALGARVEIVERKDGAVILRSLPPDPPPGPAAEQRQPQSLRDSATQRDAGMVDALRAVLLFYAGPPWTEENMTEWLQLTGSWDVTTRVLCDKARAALGEVAP